MLNRTKGTVAEFPLLSAIRLLIICSYCLHCQKHTEEIDFLLELWSWFLCWCDNNVSHWVTDFVVRICIHYSLEWLLYWRYARCHLGPFHRMRGFSPPRMIAFFYVEWKSRFNFSFYYLMNLISWKETFSFWFIFSYKSNLTQCSLHFPQ